MALGASQFTELLASTRDKVTTQGAVDNVSTPNELLDVIKPMFKNGTGESLRCNLELAEDGSATWTDASGTFLTGLSGEIIGSAVYQWSSPLVSRVRLAYKTLQQNAGPEALIKLAVTHMKAAEKQHARTLQSALTALAGSTVGGVVSLDVLVSDIAALGGIDPAVQDHWKATRIYRPTEDGTIVEALRDLVDGISDAGGDTTGLILLAGKDAFREYERSLDEKVRYTSMTTGETRFRQVEFDGYVLRRCPQIQVDRVYALQPKTIEAEYLNGNFMKVLAAQSIPGTLDYITPLASIVAVGTSKRNDHGLMVRAEEPLTRLA